MGACPKPYRSSVLPVFVPIASIVEGALIDAREAVVSSRCDLPSGKIERNAMYVYAIVFSASSCIQNKSSTSITERSSSMTRIYSQSDIPHAYSQQPRMASPRAA